MTCQLTHVNKEIKTFNSKLKKIGKLFNRVTIFDYNSDRNCFTQHGLHNTGFGKGLLEKQVASLVYKLSGMKTEEHIILKWKMALNDNSTAIKQQAISLLNDINSWFRSNLLQLN
jgi:hypothetical protein